MGKSDNSEVINWAQFFPSDENKLGAYLTKSGRPINCRLDFRLTRLEELKKAAVVVSELNAKLQKFAYEVEGDPVLRVMLARGLFAQAQFDLKYVNPSLIVKSAAKRTAEAVKKVKKLKKEKTTPIALGDILGFGRSTDQT